jgi:hypothetical protein
VNTLTNWEPNGIIMEGVHLANVTSTIVKQRKEVKTCKIKLTILLDECLRYVRKYIFYS